MAKPCAEVASEGGVLQNIRQALLLFRRSLSGTDIERKQLRPLFHQVESTNHQLPMANCETGKMSRRSLSAAQASLTTSRSTY
jgi:hypothetical protein